MYKSDIGKVFVLICGDPGSIKRLIEEKQKCCLLRESNPGPLGGSALLSRLDYMCTGNESNGRRHTCAARNRGLIMVSERKLTNTN